MSTPEPVRDVAWMEARAKTVNRRFLFLFAAIVLIFGLLAYRTEVNANELEKQQQATRQAFYDACLVRVDRQEQANVGREAMVTLASHGPNAPTDPAKLAVLVKQLRDALLLPIEDCGDPP